MRNLLAVSVLLLSTPVLADSCEHSARRDFDIDAAGLEALVIEPGWADIRVQGVPGLDRVEVRGKACASSAELLEQLTVSEHREGARAIVRAGRSIDSTSLFRAVRLSLDIEVRVPPSLALEVDSGSGDGVVRDVASLNWKSGSGDLEARNVAGDMTVRVGSGDVEAEDVGRFELVSTGSGDIEVSGVRGDVEVGGGGSGDLQFVRVAGNVRIGSIGSGDVTLRDIERDVFVESTGSGDVSADGVRGNLTVRSQGSGDTTHRNVAGKVDVPDDD